MPTSRALRVPSRAAEVRMSAGRRPRAASRRPSTSGSAAGSATTAVARTMSRTSLWPEVDGPGAQHKACSWRRQSGSLPHAWHCMAGRPRSAPRRTLIASTKESCSRWREDRGLSSHIHSWDVVSSHRSAMRRTSCHASGQFSAASRCDSSETRKSSTTAARRCCKCCAGCSRRGPRPPSRQVGHCRGQWLARHVQRAGAQPAQRQSWPQRLPPRWRKSAARSPCGRRRGESQGWQWPHPQQHRRPQRIRQRGHQPAACPQRCASSRASFRCGCDEREKGLFGGGAQADATMTHATLSLSDRDIRQVATEHARRHGRVARHRAGQ